MSGTSRVYGIGETLLDIIFRDGQPVAARPGGSVLNAMVSLGRADIHCSFISEYAGDQTGETIDRFLSGNRVGTEHVYRYRQGKTALALAFLDENNNAGYTFYKDYPEERMKGSIPEMRTGDLVLFGSFSALTPELRPALVNILNKAKSKGAFILYDPNFRQSHAENLHSLLPMVVENMQFANLVRGSDEDFHHLFGATDPISAYRETSKYCPILVYTRGGEKVTVCTPGHQKDYPVKKVRALSTIGAGDNFNAGLLYAMARETIDFRDIRDGQHPAWNTLIHYATLFAADVCSGYDNYISEKTASALRLV